MYRIKNLTADIQRLYLEEATLGGARGGGVIGRDIIR